MEIKKLPLKKINPNNPNHEWLNKHYPGALHLIFMQGFAAVTYAKKFAGWGYKNGYTIQEGLKFNWHWDLRELRRVRKIFLDKLKGGLDFLNDYYENWEKAHKENMISKILRKILVKIY